VETTHQGRTTSKSEEREGESVEKGGKEEYTGEGMKCVWRKWAGEEENDTELENGPP